MNPPRLHVAQDLLSELRNAALEGYDILLVHDDTQIGDIVGLPIATHKLAPGFVNLLFTPEQAGKLADLLEEGDQEHVAG